MERDRQLDTRDGLVQEISRFLARKGVEDFAVYLAPTGKTVSVNFTVQCDRKPRAKK